MNKLVIIGAGSFASEVGNLAAETGAWQVTAFVDTRLSKGDSGSLDGLPILSLADSVELAGNHQATCALGTTHRSSSISAAEAVGFHFTSIVHPLAHIPASVNIAYGVIIGPGVIIGHACVLGAYTIVNRGVLIGHHTNIGALSILAPGANIAARVNIAERCYIGMGSMVLDGRSVATQAVVGAGAVVTRDVAKRTQVLGMPAKVVKNNIDGL